MNVKNDPNHHLLHFDTIWKKWNHLCHGKLHGLKNRILKSLKSLLYETSTTDQKLEKWENSINHFRGNHEYCPPHVEEKSWSNKDDESAIHSLLGVISDIIPIILNFESYHTTNFNENFHSIKARLLLKTMNHDYWAMGRMFTTILQYNDPDFWIFQLFDYFHLAALPAATLKKVLQIFKQRQAKRLIDQSQKYQKRLNRFKAFKRIQLRRELTSRNPFAHPYRKKTMHKINFNFSFNLFRT